MAGGIHIRSAGKVDTIWPFTGEGGANASYGRALEHPGFVAPMPTAAGGLVSTVLSANVAYYGRFVPSSPRILNKIAFYLNVLAGTNDTCDVGVYDAAGERLISAGSTAALLNSVLGWKEINVTDTPLETGTTYYAAFSVGAIGGTVPQLVMRSWLVAGMSEPFGAAIGDVEAFYGAASHPLPATAVKTGALSACPVLSLRD